MQACVKKNKNHKNVIGGSHAFNRGTCESLLRRSNARDRKLILMIESTLLILPSVQIYIVI